MDLALNSSHDLYVTNQDLTLTTNENIVGQRLSTRLQFLLGEWFLDNTVGIPYTGVIFEQGTNISVIYAIFRNEIKQTEGVKKLNKLILTPSSNKSLSISFQVVQNNDIILDQIIILRL